MSGDPIRLSRADAAVIIGVLANVEASLMDEASAAAISTLHKRLHRDLSRYGLATEDSDDRIGLAGITQRLHEALGDVKTPPN